MTCTERSLVNKQQTPIYCNLSALIFQNYDYSFLGSSYEKLASDATNENLIVVYCSPWNLRHLFLLWWKLLLNDSTVGRCLGTTFTVLCIVMSDFTAQKCSTWLLYLYCRCLDPIFHQQCFHTPFSWSDRFWCQTRGMSPVICSHLVHSQQYRFLFLSQR